LRIFMEPAFDESCVIGKSKRSPYGRGRRKSRAATPSFAPFILHAAKPWLHALKEMPVRRRVWAERIPCWRLA
jgi:hypothetical protein